MYLLILYQNPVAVVDLVLDDLCGEARKRFGFPLKFIVLILHFDRFVSCGFSRRAEERQTVLLGFIRRGFKGNLGVIHNGRSHAVDKGDDFDRFAYHIRRHTDAGLAVSVQGIEQITRDQAIALFKVRSDSLPSSAVDYICADISIQ